MYCQKETSFLSLGIKFREWNLMGRAECLAVSLCVWFCFLSLVCLEPFRNFFFFLPLNHRAGLSVPKTMFKLDYKTATRYDGCNNILSRLNIKADDNYHPLLAYTVSFSAKHVFVAWWFQKQNVLNFGHNNQDVIFG